ncbi:MAG: hypothetical protein GY903_13370 [Fuerstiella sp.]|nr:hypothetical protein [Fuerstiella sp.]MCP4855475.1 hypothetical protein [Fuerstiella sp.]
MKRLTTATLLMAIVSGLTGCSAISDCCISVETDIRNDVLAMKAWGHWSWAYDDLAYPWHFAKGFKEGYRDVLNGGKGCQPTIPPQHYWKPCYQSMEGKNKINSWFDGFSHGALAAAQDGYGDMGQIPISPTAKANLESSRRRPAPNMLEGGGQTGVPIAVDATPDEVLVDPTDDSADPLVLPDDPSRPIQLRPYE